MNFWILSSRLARTRRDLANNSDKKPKIRRKFAKKNSSQKSQSHAKSHRSTQFQTWNLHVNMMNCIARHNFKLRNDSFSYENGGPGIFRSLSLFKMHQKNVLVHALFRDPLRKPCRWFLPKIACFEPLEIKKILIKRSIINPNSTNIKTFNRFWK